MGIWVWAALLLVLAAAASSVLFVVKTFGRGNFSFKFFLWCSVMWGAVCGMVIAKPASQIPAAQETLFLPLETLSSSPSAGSATAGDGWAAPPAGSKNGGKKRNIVPEEERWAKIIHPLGVLLRAEPSEEADVLYGLAVSQLVLLEEEQPVEGWVKVIVVEGGLAGWVPCDCLVELPINSRGENNDHKKDDRVGSGTGKNNGR